MKYAQYTIKGNDNLRRLAHVLLGDFTRWRELVEINDLDNPYIVANKADYLGLTVLEPGDTLLYPRGDTTTAIKQDKRHPYGRDVSMSTDGYLQWQGGSFALTSGLENLRQALERRLNTPLGNLPAHPDTYGQTMWQYIGRPADHQNLETLLLEARRATVADSRVAELQANIVLQGTTGHAFITAYVTPQEQSLGILEVTQTVRL